MKLTEMTVENFRSIKSCHVTFGEVNAVIGENNAGKTALLRALNSVFNWKYEEPFFVNNTHQYSPRAQTKISLVFEAVPDKEVYKDKTTDDKLTLLLSYSYSITKRRKYLYVVTRQEKIQVDDTFLLELKKDIDYVYVPAGRGNKELLWSESSIFGRTLTEYSKSILQNRDTLSNQITKISDAFKKKIFEHMEKDLYAASMLESSEKYELRFADDLDYTIFLSHIGLCIDESDRSLPIGEYGSGIKSVTVIALYRAMAKLQGANVILGIEEPETNLHPHAQKRLIASLKSNGQDLEVQAIFATHSTVIVDELRHEDVILARRVPDSKRGFHTEYTQLSASFWSDYNLDEYKHNNFFQYRNSEFFFARFVVIVESITDAQVIRKLIEDKIGERIYHISIRNLDGVKNLKYPYFLLKSLEIPFAMVVDRDFLSPYENDSLNGSRDSTTYLPAYKVVANKNSSVIQDLWRTSSDLIDLEKYLKKSYTMLFDHCKKRHLYIMQYCLEMDLVASSKGRSEYCKVFDIEDNDSAYKKLLIDKKDAIKSPDKVLKVLSGLRPADYPHSYKKIRSGLSEEINSVVQI